MALEYPFKVIPFTDWEGGCRICKPYNCKLKPHTTIICGFGFKAFFFQDDQYFLHHHLSSSPEYITTTVNGP